MKTNPTIILSPRFEMLKGSNDTVLQTYPGGRAQLEREIVSLVASEETEFQAAWNTGGTPPTEIRLMRGEALRAIVSNSLGVLNDASLLELAGDYLLLLDVRDAIRLAETRSDFWEHALAEAGVPEKLPSQRRLWPWAILIAAAAIVLITLSLWAFILKPRLARQQSDLAAKQERAELALVQTKIADRLRESSTDSRNRFVLDQMNQAVRSEFSEPSSNPRTRSFDQALVALSVDVLRQIPSDPIELVNGLQLPALGDLKHDDQRTAFYEGASAIRQLKWLIPSLALPDSSASHAMKVVIEVTTAGTVHADWTNSDGHHVRSATMEFSNAAAPLPLLPYFNTRRYESGDATVREIGRTDADHSPDALLVTFAGGQPGEVTMVASSDEQFNLDPRAAGAEMCFEARLLHAIPRARFRFGIGGDQILNSSSTPPLAMTTAWQPVWLSTTVQSRGSPLIGLAIELLDPSGPGADCELEIRHAYLRQILPIPVAVGSPAR
jgi:hypothetical protein